MDTVVIRTFREVVSRSGAPRAEGRFKPLSEIPKALQNRAKLNLIVKTVKNCWI